MYLPYYLNMKPKTKKSNTIDVSILIITHNNINHIDDCLQSIFSNKINQIEIIVLDNNSDDGTYSYVKKKYAQKIILKKNISNQGFSKAVNKAYTFSKGKYILLLNPDIILEEDALVKALEYIEKNKNSVLGIRLLSEQHTLQPSCRSFPTPLKLFLRKIGLLKNIDMKNSCRNNILRCDWIPGCFMLIPRHLLKLNIILDKRFYMYYEDIDFCREMQKKGVKVIYNPHIEAIHKGGGSSSNELRQTLLDFESELRYYQKHEGLGILVEGIILSLIADSFIMLKHILSLKSIKMDYLIITKKIMVVKKQLFGDSYVQKNIT